MRISKVSVVSVSVVGVGQIALNRMVEISEGGAVLGNVPVVTSLWAGDPRPELDDATGATLDKLFTPDVVDAVAKMRADAAAAADAPRRKLFDDAIAALTAARGPEFDQGHENVVREIDAAIPTLERMRDNNEPFDKAAVPLI